VSSALGGTAYCGITRSDVPLHSFPSPPILLVFPLPCLNPVHRLVEAELKHCRIAMLGALGMIFPEFYHLPNAAYSQTNPLAAVPSVGFAPVAQILLFMVVLEAISYQKINYNPSAPAGDFGFDPLGLAKNESARKRFALSEVKNGRLAMIACGGMIHHALITHQGPITQIQQGHFIGGDYPFGV